MGPRFRIAAWILALGAALGVRLWNALEGPLMWGYDAWGHVAYVLFLDLYHAVPYADQGWSYFHPPLHYLLASPLAREGDSEVLIRGLALMGSAASLGIAFLAARLAGRADNAPPWASLVAFSAVALLPVHLYTSPMPGNEMTASLISGAALLALVARERRGRGGIGDFGLGLLIGLAMLTKFSGLLVLGAVGVALFLRAWRAPDRVRGFVRNGVRGFIICVSALLVCGPYLARNTAEFDTPFKLSRDYALVSAVERSQPPGKRTWRHFVSFPHEIFTHPNPLSPALVGSIWGTIHLNVWSDGFRESDRLPALDVNPRVLRIHGVMAALGLLPTLLGILGAVWAAGDVAAGRRRALYEPLFAYASLALLAFIAFAIRVPHFSAVKATYLMGLSIPFGVFLARAFEGLAMRGKGMRTLAIAACLSAALASVAVNSVGLLLPRRKDNPGASAVQFFFGEYESARKIYSLRLPNDPSASHWIENAAATHLAGGNLKRAIELYRRLVRPDPSAPRLNQLAVALALDGQYESALAALGRSLARQPSPEAFVNRGAIRAQMGVPLAEDDFRTALRHAPNLVPAWRNLETLLARSNPGAVSEVAAQSTRAACTPPRDFPHGIGRGDITEYAVGRRSMLLWNGESLALAGPEAFRTPCDWTLRRALAFPTSRAGGA